MVLGPAGGEGLNEGPNEAAVATGVRVIAGAFDEMSLAFPGTEVQHLYLAAVALEASVGAEDLGLTEGELGEGCHRQRRGGAALVLEVDHLVVHHIVVAAVDAATVGTCPQRIQHTFFCAGGGDSLQWPPFGSGITQAAQINPLRRVGTIRLEYTVDAALAGIRGALLGTKVVKVTERGHTTRWPPNQMAEPVDVMHTLGHQHKRRLVGAPPVAAYEGVRLMPPADRLEMLHRHDLTDDARVEESPQDPGVWGVAKDMAHGECDPSRPRR